MPDIMECVHWIYNPNINIWSIARLDNNPSGTRNVYTWLCVFRDQMLAVWFSSNESPRMNSYSHKQVPGLVFSTYKVLYFLMSPQWSRLEQGAGERRNGKLSAAHICIATQVIGLQKSTTIRTLHGRSLYAECSCVVVAAQSWICNNRPRVYLRYPFGNSWKF